MSLVQQFESELLVFAAYLAAFVAIISAFTAAKTASQNRRSAIREKWVSEFRDAMSNWLSSIDRIPFDDKSGIIDFIRVENHLELSFDIKDKMIIELRDAMQDLRFAVSNHGDPADAFKARSKVLSLARTIIQEEIEKAQQGK